MSADVVTWAGLQEPAAFGRLRMLLLGTLLLGIVGTGAELLLLGHYESVAQFVPLVLLSLGLASIAWHLATPGVASLRALQATMLLFVVSGGIGVGLHVDGNVEFEREMYPSLGGFDLIGKTMTGESPVLAP